MIPALGIEGRGLSVTVSCFGHSAIAATKKHDRIRNTGCGTSCDVDKDKAELAGEGEGFFS